MQGSLSVSMLLSSNCYGLLLMKLHYTEIYSHIIAFNTVIVLFQVTVNRLKAMYVICNFELDIHDWTVKYNSTV